MHEIDDLKSLFGVSVDTSFCKNKDEVNYLLMEAHTFPGQILNNEEWLQKFTKVWDISYDRAVEAYQATCKYMEDLMVPDGQVAGEGTITMEVAKSSSGFLDLMSQLIANSFTEKVDFSINSIRNLQAACLFANLIVLSMQGSKFTKSQ